jgi:Domain of unknown function (DU1801)
VAITRKTLLRHNKIVVSFQSDSHICSQEETMAELKTKPTDTSADSFVAALPDEKKRKDSLALLEMLRQVTGEQPRMWGDSIVGFGSYHYAYAGGRKGDWFVTGFSPRKQNLTLYVMGGFEQHADLLARLGKHKLGKGCLYINKLQDVDQEVLRQLLAAAVAQAQGASDSDPG